MLQRDAWSSKDYAKDPLHPLAVRLQPSGALTQDADVDACDDESISGRKAIRWWLSEDYTSDDNQISKTDIIDEELALHPHQHPHVAELTSICPAAFARHAQPAKPIEKGWINWKKFKTALRSAKVVPCSKETLR